MSLTRRDTLLGLTALSVTPAALARAQSGAKIVIIGGGFGGASAAGTLKRLMPHASVTLVEPNPEFISCPFSNLVLVGERDIAQQTFGYDGLKRRGVSVVQTKASDVDPVARTVALETGDTLFYDRLVLSPGIDIRWGALEGYDEAAAEIMPHAWKAGQQTLLLRDQLAAMEPGGVVVISAPAAPFRCPPGPYERASLIAHYLKTQKPRSKLLILDSKDAFSKKPLFLDAWADQFADILEWRGASNDGRISRVVPAEGVIETDFETIKADVANVIPPQKAGIIADRAGVADATGWCPIDAMTFASTLQPDIHVIGDASIAAPMPKSAFAANAQAKMCAIQIARSISGLEPLGTTLANTCYSYINPDEAVSVSGVYHNDGGALSEVSGAGGLSPLEPEGDERNLEALQAADWFETITAEAFG